MILNCTKNIVCSIIICGFSILYLDDIAAKSSSNVSNISTEKPTLPHFFEENLGQFDQSYRFIAHNKNNYFAYGEQHVAISLSGSKGNNSLQLVFNESNEKPEIIGEQKRDHVIHYLRGKKAEALRNIPTYSQLRYFDVYPGIDVQFYFSHTLLEYDFIIKPNVDPSQISLSFNDADNVSLTTTGELAIEIDGKTVFQKVPISYQQINGKRHEVESAYQIVGDIIGFQLAAYDKNHPLIIDPIIEFSSYFGGEWEDQANEIKSDSNGNIWLSGATATKTRITFKNEMTLANTALTPLDDGSGIHFYQDEHGVGLPNSFKEDAVTVDIENERKFQLIDGKLEEETFIYDCRYEYSGSFNNDRLITDYDAFLTKLDSNMDPIFTTYFGGCGNDGVRDMVIDDNDNVYLVGFTLSEDLPTKSSVQSALATSRFESETEKFQADAFYAKFDSDGFLIYSSYLGGNGRDGARAAAVDADENLYITGYSHSTNLATTPCFAGTNNVIACDYIGGIDSTAATVNSNDVSIYADAFIARIAKDGDAIDFLTYFGGNLDDWGQSIVLQSDGIVVAGNTASNNLPSVSAGYSFAAMNRQFVAKDGGIVEKPCTRLKTEEFLDLRLADAHVCEDLFITKLSFDGTELVFSTYLGGDKDDNITDMLVDSNDNLYLFGTTRSQGAQLLDGKAETFRDSSLNDRYPLYKHIKLFDFEINSLSTIAFFTILDPTASELLMSSFIGAEDDDAGIAIAIYEKAFSGGELTEAEVFLAGHTISKNFFTDNAFQSRSANSDLFLVKFDLFLDKFSEPYSIDSENPGGCNKDACDLYDLKYSTFIGGEDLDALKGISYSTFDNQLLLTGSTFSRLFPLTEDALKTEIQLISQIEYEPISRAIIDQFDYYPSDTFIMKISDDSESGDIAISLTNSLDGEVKEDDFVSYNLRVKNDSATIVAKSVRLIVNFPNISVEEKLSKYIKTDLENCVLELRNLYCVIGDLAVNEQMDFAIDISARNSGTFTTDFSVMAMTADKNVANNSLSVSVSVKGKSSKSFLGMGSFMLLLGCVMLVFRRMYPNVA